jgi:multidrug efflux pump subunit AcrA (membrane-fusion protein)
MKTIVTGLLLAVLVLTLALLNARRAASLATAELERNRAELAEQRSRLDENQNAGARTENSNSDRPDLLKLRAEVTRLRQELGDRKIAAPTKSVTPPAENPPSIPLAGDRLFASRTNQPVSPEDEAVRQALNQKESDLQAWWKAFKSYAAEHDGNLPIDFSEAIPYLPADFQQTIDISNFMRPSPSGLRPNLKNMEEPKRTVLFKERNPLVLSDGVVCNVWFFADGSVQLFRE